MSEAVLKAIAKREKRNAPAPKKTKAEAPRAEVKKEPDGPARES